MTAAPPAPSDARADRRSTIVRGWAGSASSGHGAWRPMAAFARPAASPPRESSSCRSPPARSECPCRYGPPLLRSPTAALSRPVGDRVAHAGAHRPRQHLGHVAPTGPARRRWRSPVSSSRLRGHRVEHLPQRRPLGRPHLVGAGRPGVPRGRHRAEHDDGPAGRSVQLLLQPGGLRHAELRAVAQRVAGQVGHVPPDRRLSSRMKSTSPIDQAR